MDQRKALGKMLRRLAECVDSSSPAEIDDLLLGRKILRIAAVEGHGGASRQPEVKAEWADLSSLAGKLQQLPSREDGYHVLDEAGLTKKRLEDLARLLQLPVTRQDNMDRLEEKIIEECIGSRLNSVAIRGGNDAAR